MATGDLYKTLAPAAPLTQEEADLFRWLKLNRSNFMSVVIDDATGEECPKYSLYEITRFALSEGFSSYLVYKHLSHLICALRGSRIDNVVATEMYRFDVGMEILAELRAKLDYCPELDLAPLWRDYLAYACEGRDFLEAA